MNTFLMEIIRTFFYSLFLVPGALQIVTFIILFGLLTWIGKFTTHRSAAALIGTGSLLALIGGTAPYWIFTHLLVAGIGVFLWKISPSSQVMSLPIVMALYGLTYYEVAEVKAIFPSTATWQIGERGTPGSGNPPERLVELKFGINHDQVEGRYSDALADYLLEKNVSILTIEIPIFYSWGVAHGMGVVLIDGKDFPSQGGGYGSWSADKPQAPFPKYFFGLKDFNSINGP